MKFTLRADEAAEKGGSTVNRPKNILSVAKVNLEIARFAAQLKSCSFKSSGLFHGLFSRIP
jgi:hypothetical protein